MITIAAVLEWIGLLDQIRQRGQGTYDAIKGVMAQHGIDADLMALDNVIADAERRQALAHREVITGGHTPPIKGETE